MTAKETKVETPVAEVKAPEKKKEVQLKVVKADKALPTPTGGLSKRQVFSGGLISSRPDDPQGEVKEPMKVGDSPVFTQEDRYYRKATRNAKLSEVTGVGLTIKDFDALTHGVVVMGSLLAPVKTIKGSVLNNPLTLSGEEEEDAPTPFGSWGWGWGRSHDQEQLKPDPEEDFFLYRFVMNGESVYLIMDGKSKVWFGTQANQNFDWSLQDYQIDYKGPVNILMRNSLVIDSHFYGNVTLANVDIRESVVHSSSILVYKDSPSAQRLRKWTAFRQPWGYKEGDRYSYKNSRFINTNVDNSDLSSGTYYQGYFNNSQVQVEGDITTIDACLTESTVKGMGRVFLGDVRMRDTSVEAKGVVLINMASMTDMFVRSSAVYARNKFAITDIDVPSQHGLQLSSYKLTRISRTEVELDVCKGENSKKVILLGTGEWNLPHDLREWLRETDVSHEDNTKNSPPAPHSVIRESIHNYVIDTVVSRIKMINMLDDVTKVAGGLENKGVAYQFQRYF